MSVPIIVSCEASETGFGVLVNNGLMFDYRKGKISDGRLMSRT
jgi:hypothetical protein